MDARDRVLTACTLAYVICGCTGSDLHLRLDLPEAYRAAAARIRLEVLYPPPGEPFDCEALALGEVSGAHISASRGRMFDVRVTETIPITDIEVAPFKIFLVTGLDASGEQLFVACATAEDLSDNLEIELRAEPVLAVRDPPKLTGHVEVAGLPLSAPITFSLVDRLGRPAADGLLLVVTRSTGTAKSERVRADKSGHVSIHPTLHSTPGPFAVEVTPRWGKAEAFSFSGIAFRDPPHPEPFRVPASIVHAVSGRFGPGGRRGIAALVLEGLQVSIRFYAFDSSTEALVETATAALPMSTLPVIGPPRSEEDRLFVITKTDWMEVAATGHMTRRSFEPLAGQPVPIGVFAYGPCGAETMQIAVDYDQDTIAIYNHTGGAPLRISEVLNPVHATGCTDIDGELVRLSVFRTGSPVGVLIAAEPAGREPLFGTWLALPQSVTFVPTADGDTLLGLQLLFDRLSFTRGLVTTSDVLEVTGIPIFAPLFFPTAVVGGHLANDAHLDVASLFELPASSSNSQRQHGLALVTGGESLSEITGHALFEQPLCSPMLFLEDFDADGVDDVMVVDRLPVFCGGPPTSQVHLYRMGSAED